MQVSQPKAANKAPLAEVKFLPVKDIMADVYIQDSIAIIKMVHEYYNPTHANGVKNDDAIECTFSFPKLANCTISKMIIQIGDQVVQTVIMEKERAEQRYDDIIAAGNAAAILK